MKRRDDIRNVAIIAHVDHGKTTLVDAMLRQSGQFRASQLQGERILDSNDLERERGITILAKNIAINYGDDQDQHHRHARPRRLRRRGRADPPDGRRGASCWSTPSKGRCPRPSSSSARRSPTSIRPIVVINKIDRPDARPDEVLNEVFDTFVELGAERGAARLPLHLRLRARRASPRTTRTRPSGDIKPLLRPDRREGPRPRGRPRRPVPDALHDARLLRVRRPDRHRPDRLGPGQARARRPR